VEEAGVGTEDISFVPKLDRTGQLYRQTDKTHTQVFMYTHTDSTLILQAYFLSLRKESRPKTR
jgi:hypothetical protein